MNLSNVKIGHMTKFYRHLGPKGPKQVKMGRKPSKFDYFDLILTLGIWMPTEVGHLANFDITNVYMNEKCLT